MENLGVVSKKGPDFFRVTLVKAYCTVIGYVWLGHVVAAACPFHFVPLRFNSLSLSLW